MNSSGGNADLEFSVVNNVLSVTSSDSVFAVDSNGLRNNITLPEVQGLINTQVVYSTGTIHFAVNRFSPLGNIQAVHTPASEVHLNDAIQAEVTVGDNSGRVIAFGTKGIAGEPSEISVGGLRVNVSYGSKKSSCHLHYTFRNFSWKGIRVQTALLHLRVK